MSKKTSRGRRPNLPAAAFNSPATAALAGASSASISTSSSKQPATAARAIDWQGEYGDVMNDLKRTGLIAVVLLAVLIVLSFVL